MAYRISTGRSFGREVQRLFNQQVVAAVSCLTDTSSASAGHRVHQARRHIKKARALAQIAKGPLGSTWREIDEELQTVNRALGPLADATRHCETIRHFQQSNPSRLPTALFDVVRARLESHASATSRQSRQAGVHARAVRLLDSVRRQALAWDLSDLDAGQIVHEVRDAHASARHARRRVKQRPTVDTYHRWRCRVKREFHLLRLITDLIGDRLTDERHQLAALGATLGRVHDIDILIVAIAADSPLDRHDTARMLVSLRTEARDQRHRVDALAAVLDERPRDLARRLRALWGMAPRAAAVSEPQCLRRA